MASETETEQQACPVCASAIEPWRTRRTAYGSYQIDRCRRCGFAFVNPRPSLDYLMEFYSTLGYGNAGRVEAVPTRESILAEERADPHSTLDAQRLAHSITEMQVPVVEGRRRFLDVGCGYGFFTVEAMARGFEVTALDLSTNKRKVMKEMTGLDPVASSFEEFECAPGSFSAVLMSQILEHVSDINLWMVKARDILAEGGVLAVALPNFDNAFRFVRKERSPYIIPPEHLNFFNPRSLSCLLEKHGFQVEGVQWVSRIPRRILRNRLPRAARPMTPVVDALARVAFGALDALHLGLMINVYGRKVGGQSHGST